MAMASPEDDFYRLIANAQMNPKSVYLNRYMDDMTLIVAPESADTCFEALSHTLAEAGTKLDEDKRTAWATDGSPLDTPRAQALWDQAKDQRGFIAGDFPQRSKTPSQKHRWHSQSETPSTSMTS